MGLLGHVVTVSDGRGTAALFALEAGPLAPASSARGPHALASLPGLLFRWSFSAVGSLTGVCPLTGEGVSLGYAFP